MRSPHTAAQVKTHSVQYFSNRQRACRSFWPCVKTADLTSPSPGFEEGSGKLVQADDQTRRALVQSFRLQNDDDWSCDYLRRALEDCTPSDT